MYILLENGMEIKGSDEVFICDEDYVSWESVTDHFVITDKYNEERMMPIRRKIDTIEELFTSYNIRSVQRAKPRKTRAQ